MAANCTQPYNLTTLGAVKGAMHAKMTKPIQEKTS